MDFGALHAEQWNDPPTFMNVRTHTEYFRFDLRFAMVHEVVLKWATVTNLVGFACDFPLLTCSW